MAFDLLDTLKNVFNNEFSNKAAASLGESESNVQKAIGGIIPTVLTGLLNKAGSPGDAGSLAGLVKEAASGDFSRLGSLAGAIPAELLAKGSEILKSLFGSKAADITGAIASYAGIKTTSAETLLQSAAPASLGIIGQQAASQNLSASGLIGLLNSQKDKILAAVPSGLGLASILGLGSLGDIGKKLGSMVSGISGIGGTAGKAIASEGKAVESAVSYRWLWMLIVLLAIILLLWYFMKGCNNQHTMAPVDSVQTSHMEDSAISHVSPPVSRESIKVMLPDGVELAAYKGGIEDQLVSFLKDPSTQGGKDKWFDFDNLNFKTGSAELTEDSKVQVQNLVAILNAFPKLKIKIGGYTDARGDSTLNRKLSQERADAVHSALQAHHVKPVQLLGAEGYGSQFAKAAADAPDEERVKDRRISVGVREK
ncbi:OmpA family protein [Chitinophaga niabensis]|uniref:OmpA family protein n=1 Tax=Chitinophaga niabensis TaxID=536979 RepID=UPI0031BA57BC